MQVNRVRVNLNPALNLSPETSSLRVLPPALDEPDARIAFNLILFEKRRFGADLVDFYIASEAEHDQVLSLPCALSHEC